MEKPPFEDEPLEPGIANEERLDALAQQSSQYYEEIEKLEIEIEECSDVEEKNKLQERFGRVTKKYVKIRDELFFGCSPIFKEKK
jgi:hypothetical protein